MTRWLLHGLSALLLGSAGPAAASIFRSDTSLESIFELISPGSEPFSDQLFTPVHAAGTCAIRGHCGKSSIFSPELPCVDNGDAQKSQLSRAGREKLLDLCGEEWEGIVDERGACCDDGQIDALESNLQRVDQIIGSCPACRKNFFSLFCTFTCSPDQSRFVNVTTAKVMSRQQTPAVQSLTVGLTEQFGTELYNSCQDVKFGSGMRAIDLIGGGAKNHNDMLAFIGRKRLGGSPFEMNFVEQVDRPMALQDIPAKRCDGDEADYRCSCDDCKGVCPTLPKVRSRSCRVGTVPCVTVLVVIVYAAALLLFTLLYIAQHRRPKQLIHNSSNVYDGQQVDYSSADEDDGVAFDPQWKPKGQQYWLTLELENIFQKIGYGCAKRPFLTIGLGLASCLICCMGWSHIKLETDPINLWVPPDSSAAIERRYFESNMGPVIRSEQLIAVNETGPILSRQTLEWWVGVEERVARLRGYVESESASDLEDGFYRDSGYGVGWEDICLKPTGSCFVQSVGGYFKGHSLDGWEDRVKECTDVPVDCLVNGVPIDGDLVLGHRPDAESENGGFDVLDSQAMILTWVIDGSKGLVDIKSWEDVLVPVFRDIESEGRNLGLRISYNTGKSLERELEKTAGMDVWVIAVSYLAMFCYVTLMLSSWRGSFPSITFRGKILVGLSGILIVVLSVAAAVGILSFAGLSVTLIIAEVIPFLVLAVGVDNVFLLVHSVENAKRVRSSGLVGRWEAATLIIRPALSRIGPSIALSTTAEVVLFLIGAAVGMPAVRNFAIYAALSVFINAVLQVTVFVAILALDVALQDEVDEEEPKGIITEFVQTWYAPAIVRRRKEILAVAFTSFAVCLAFLVPQVQLGLDQRLALPGGSHLIRYFDDLADYFQKGPPAFFVVEGVDAMKREDQAVLCSKLAGCEGESVPTVLSLETRRSNVSYLTGGVASWEDDFWRWLDPAMGCCKTGSGEECWPGYDRRLGSMPTGQELSGLVKQWTEMIPDQDCPLGGSPYRDAIVFGEDESSIEASHFRASHTPLRTQSDFIRAYESARRIADDLSKLVGARVFPFSDFYVFFHQYLTIISLAVKLLLWGAAAVFTMTWLFLGCRMTAGVMTAVVSSTVVHVIASMWAFGVSLNAVSLVNLLICAGLAVEFCVHIARAYTVPEPSIMERSMGSFESNVPDLSMADLSECVRGRAETDPWAATQQGSWSAKRCKRAAVALVDIGPAVAEGIGLTKVVGITVLAFGQSKIFEVYYFRMWAALVVIALVHSLVVLPAALACFGGRAWWSEKTKANRDFGRRQVPEDDASDHWRGDQYGVDEEEEEGRQG